MHPNPIYRNQPLAEMQAFARARGFGTLAVNGQGGAPLLSHVPFWVSPDCDRIEMHLVRSNPIARLGGPVAAVLAVQGADAYVSPDWYGLEEQVPTWNYLAVHLRGRLEPLPVAHLRTHLDLLSAQFEERLLPKKPWVSAKMDPEGLARMMRMVLPFALIIEEVQGTEKLGQNKDPEVQERAGLQIIEAGLGLGAEEIGAKMRDMGRARQSR